MKGGPWRLWPALLPFLPLLLTFAAGDKQQDLRAADCPTCEETSLLQTPKKVSHRPTQTQKALTDAKDCLSFIHIPKTGGQSMETARLNSAGIQAPEGCSARTLLRLLGTCGAR